MRCSTLLNSRLWTLPDTESGKQFTIALPWDSTVQSVILAFARAQCHHIDGRVDYIVMGGLGDRIRSFITENPADTNERCQAPSRKSPNSCHAIIDAHKIKIKASDADDPNNAQMLIIEDTNLN